MKLSSFVFIAASVVSLFAANSAAQALHFGQLGDFKLESGEVIHDCRIGYRTFGQLNAGGSNAVLLPTWAGRTSEQLKNSTWRHA